MGNTDGRKPKGTKDRSILLQGLKNSIWRSENWESPRVAKAIWTSSGSWLLRWEMPLALCGWYAWEVSVTVVPLLGMYSSNKVHFWKLQLYRFVYTLQCNTEHSFGSGSFVQEGKNISFELASKDLGMSPETIQAGKLLDTALETQNMSLDGTNYFNILVNVFSQVGHQILD